MARDRLAKAGMVLLDLSVSEGETVCDNMKSSNPLINMLTFLQTTTVTKTELVSMKKNLGHAFRDSGT